MVLLGIRTAWHENPDCSPTDLVYGSTLRLPGEFVEPTPLQEFQPSSAFLRHLQKSMQNTLPPSVKYHSTHKPYLPPSLSSTGFVYVRINGHRNPLQRPYNGPFRIISTSDKYFTLNINGGPDNVSVDRLKPAYVGTFGQTELSFLTNIAPEVTTPIQQATTRSGRITRPPGHLNNFCTAQHSN